MCTDIAKKTCPWTQDHCLPNFKSLIWDEVQQGILRRIKEKVSRMFRQQETTCFSLEYVELFWLKFLQNTQHLACKVSDRTAEFWQKIIHIKWSISQPWQLGLPAPYILISKKEERYKVAGCQITEPADGTQQARDSNWPMVNYVVP